jgi:hypothetical protein
MLGVRCTMPNKWMQAESEREEKAGTKGKLRKKLGVKAGHKIPAKKLAKAAHSKNLKLKREAVMAENFRKARKSGNRKSSARKAY